MQIVLKWCNEETYYRFLNMAHTVISSTFQKGDRLEEIIMDFAALKFLTLFLKIKILSHIQIQQTIKYCHKCILSINIGRFLVSTFLFSTKNVVEKVLNIWPD